jgi:multidrug efflux pump subunit AcrB
MPIIASTATTILAFFPIIFMPGIMGEFMSYIPKTVIIVLSSSLLVGLTLNPVFCSRFLKSDSNQETNLNQGGKGFVKFQNWYIDKLKYALKKPFIVLITMIFIVILGVFLYTKTGKEPIFFPSSDPQVALVNLELPQGTPLLESDKIIRKIEALIPTVPGSIESFQGIVGRKANRDGSSKTGFQYANVRIGFKPFIDREISASFTIDHLKDSLAEFPFAKVSVDELNNGPPTGYPISYQVTGESYEIIGALSDSILQILLPYSEFKLADYDYEEGKPEIKVEIDREKAVKFGLSTSLVASTIRESMNGGIISKYRKGKKEYDIVIRYKDKNKNSISDLAAVIISKEGKYIPLSSVAQIYTQAGPGIIKRQNLRRSVQVFADFKDGVQNKEEIKISIAKKVANLDVPLGYEIGSGDGVKTQDEATAFLGQAFLIALLLIFILLIVQFNSITQPFIIMMSVFLSVGGVFWGLTLFDQEFVIIMSGIGIISLAGVVVNNAIVLIDYTNLLVKQGQTHYEAIVNASSSRLRPVLLTAITTVLGMLPMALGVAFDFSSFTLVLESESSAMWKSMAWAIIYGLIFATILTLIVVPILLELEFKIFHHKEAITEDLATDSHKLENIKHS